MSWRASARRNIFVISVGTRDGGKIETKIDRVVPLFDDASYFSFRPFVQNSLRRRFDVISPRVSLSLSLSLSLSVFLSLYRLLSFFNFFFDTADRIILVNLRFACWNYVPVAPIIFLHSKRFTISTEFCEAMKIVSRCTRMDFRVVPPAHERVSPPPDVRSVSKITDAAHAFHHEPVVLKVHRASMPDARRSKLEYRCQFSLEKKKENSSSRNGHCLVSTSFVMSVRSVRRNVSFDRSLLNNDRSRIFPGTGGVERVKAV